MQDTTSQPASLECPTMVSANGTAPVMAIIEELNQKSCRLRSINVFKVGDMLSFDFTLRGAHTIALSGKVLSSALNGTRRSYTIVLHAADAATIAGALDEAQRFAAAHPVRDVHTGNGLTRASARIPVDIDVQYWTPGGPHMTGRATNVSAGGVLMNAPEELSVGTALELRFRLPDAPNEISVHARVVAHQHESPNYNVAFFSIAAEVRTELEKFVAAHSHS